MILEDVVEKDEDNVFMVIIICTSLLLIGPSK